MKRRTCLAAIVAAGLLSQPALAELLAYEGFDYDQAGALAGNNGGTGWAAAWGNNTASPNFIAYLTNDNVSIAPPPNPFPVLGDRIDKSGQGAGAAATANRLFADPGSGLNMGTDGTLYVSFSWIKTAGSSTAGNNLEFTLHDSTLGNAIAARAGVTSGDLHFLNQSSAVTLGTDDYGAITPGQTYFTVLKLTASAAGQDIVQAINFTTTPPLAEPATWDKTANVNVADGVNVNQFRLTMGNNTRAQFDELRVGTTWAAAAGIPEPSSLALFAAGALGVGRMRRRGGVACGDGY